MLSNYKAQGRAIDGKYVFESNIILFTKSQGSQNFNFFNLFSLVILFTIDNLTKNYFKN